MTRAAAALAVGLAGCLACASAAPAPAGPAATDEALATAAASGIGGLPAWIECARGRPDSDRDGTADTCEHALASAFAPTLVMDPADCAWDAAATPARIRGGYYHAAQSIDTGRVRIAYLPAYARDCGWSGPKCLLPGVDCRPHAGDSEGITLELEYDAAAGRWRTRAIHLSAHCFEGTSADCRWHAGEALARFEWRGAPLGAPVVRVASGRHANYASRGACDRGHYFLDSCAPDALPVVFPVDAERGNVGSAAAPIHGTGCVDAGQAGLADGEGGADGALECFWSDRPFRGWQGDAHPGVTPYRRYLAQVAGF